MGNLYKNISISDYTKEKRKQIRLLQDEFMTFSWGGVDAFESFGAFIINQSKGSLKFYNGPSFSNEYTKPQFDNAGGKLLGVSFNKQTIDFTIGVYWISIEHYRLLIDWLNPLKVADLSFGHSPKYRYNVKLSKIGDSTRWIVGHESIKGESKPMYYTELNLTFEVQGDPCAKGVNSYEWHTRKAPRTELNLKLVPSGTIWVNNKLTAASTISELRGKICLTKFYNVLKGQKYHITIDPTYLRHSDNLGYPFITISDESFTQVFLQKTLTSFSFDIEVPEDGTIYFQIVDSSVSMFEIQCVVNSDLYWELQDTSTNNQKILTIPLCTKHDFTPSDLPTPFEVSIPLQIIGDDDSQVQQKYNLSLDLEAAEKPESGEINWDSCETLPLFSIDLKNLTHTSTSGTNPLILNIVYNSQNGLVYLKYGTSTEKILTLLSLNDIGERIVDSFSSWKAKLPGEFDYPGFYDANGVRLKLIISKSYSNSSGVVAEIPSDFYSQLSNGANIICFPRTNLA